MDGFSYSDSQGFYAWSDTVAYITDREPRQIREDVRFREFFDAGMTPAAAERAAASEK
jgi:hypothetical protein